MLYHPEQFRGSHGSHGLARCISTSSASDEEDAGHHYSHPYRSIHDGEMSDSSTAFSYAIDPPSASPRSIVIPPSGTSKGFGPTCIFSHNESNNDTAKAKSFPQTLMDILDSSSPAIIEWTDNGQSFVIHDKYRFAAEILPVYFNKCAKFSSFARRLHRWGFVNAAESPSRGGASCAFSHPKFCRDMPELCLQMTAGGASSAGAGAVATAAKASGKDVGRSTSNSPFVYDNLPLPKGFGDVHAAQAVLSLGGSLHQQPFRFTSSSMCLGMTEDDDDENDGNENTCTLATGDDVASRLKRMADCCRRYDLHPNQHVATLRNGGASMVFLPKTPKSGEEIEPLFDQVRETMGDGINTGKAKRKGSSDLTDTSFSPDEVEGRTRASMPREAKRPKVDVPQQKPTVTTGASKGGMRSSPLEVYCKPAPEFGKGWIVRGFQRQSGAYEGHVDKYWYSPNSKKRFRSKAEIKRFLPVLKKCKGDEEKAYKMFK